MARQVDGSDISRVLDAAEKWIQRCLVTDHSILSHNALWTEELIGEVYHAFVEHPDFGDDDFMTKLKNQIRPASPRGQQLLAEMLWALSLFPSNIKARTKRRQVREIWAMSGEQLLENHAFLADEVLAGIGSGGPGFNNYKPNELEFLMELVPDLKRKTVSERQSILSDYELFVSWIASVPQKGFRQSRHMLRYLASRTGSREYPPIMSADPS
jgi:5-methylcytosine-specific restriction enzyme B